MRTPIYLNRGGVKIINLKIYELIHLRQKTDHNLQCCLLSYSAKYHKYIRQMTWFYTCSFDVARSQSEDVKH